jgi:hypothetical protein
MLLPRENGGLAMDGCEDNFEDCTEDEATEPGVEGRTPPTDDKVDPPCGEVDLEDEMTDLVLIVIVISIPDDVLIEDLLIRSGVFAAEF